MPRTALFDQTRKRRRYLSFLDRFTRHTQTVPAPQTEPAPGAIKSFEKLKDEKIEILDENGKPAWSFTLPVPQNNPGVICHEVQVNILTERQFGEFCKNTGPGDEGLSG